MAYQQKIDAARELIVNHYLAATGSQSNGEIAQGYAEQKWDEFKKQLIESGGTTEEALSVCSWEELRDYCGLPILLAKQVAAVWREKTKVDNGKHAFSISPKRASMMSPKELVENYDPKEPDSHVANRLKELSKGQPFLVFSGDKVDVAASLDLLTDVRNGFDGRAVFVANGEAKEVYRVGERPGSYFERNPLFPNEVLRSDGTCSQTNRSWASVPTNVRQIVFLARTVTKEIVINSVQDAHNVLDLLVVDDPYAKMVQRCPKAVVELKKKLDAGETVNLRLSKPSNGYANNTVNNPFYAAR